jgi:peptidoglycan/xylan/chitin deacetylase (PgdA/CDA1 family)
LKIPPTFKKTGVLLFPGIIFLLCFDLATCHSESRASKETEVIQTSSLVVDLRLSGVPEEKEEGEGGVLRVNADFDEQNKNERGNPLADYQPDDKQGHRIRHDDSDLLNASLFIHGDSTSGRWRLVFPENIKAWAKTGDTTYEELISSRFSDNVEVPCFCELKLEGIKGSRTLSDVRILVEFAPRESKEVFCDSVFLTVLETKFALTFDDGPLPEKTEKIVRALSGFYCDGEPVKAGFFQVTEKIRKFPELTRFVVENGHFVFNRALCLERQSSTSIFSGGIDRAILEWEDEVYQVLGTRPERIIRKRYKTGGRKFEMELDRLGARICGGELTFDFRALSEGMVVKKALEILQTWNTRENPQLHPYPAILIFHEFPEVTYDHVREIVSQLQDEGFVLVNFDPQKIY